MAKLIDGDPAVTDVAHRLIEAANDAQALRRTLSKTGTPTTRTRAIQSEVTVIGKMLHELHVTDTSIDAALEEVNSIAAVLVEFCQTEPEHARPLVDLFLKSSSPEIGEAIARKLPGDSNA